MTRHDLDLFSLLSGLALSGIALAALFDVGFGLGPWVWPTILIAVGAAVLASVLRSASPQEPTDASEDDLAADPRDPREDAVLAEARAEVDAHERTAWADDDPSRGEADRPT